MGGVFLHLSPPYFLSQILSLNLELVVKARMTVQEALESICLSSCLTLEL